MKPSEIVALIKSKSPNVLAEVEDRRATIIVRKALQAVAKSVIEAEEGRLSIPGFGVFLIKNVERRNGDHIEVVKRFIYRPDKKI